MYIVHPNGDELSTTIDSVPIVQEYISPNRNNSSIVTIESPSALLSTYDDIDGEPDEEQQEEYNQLLNHVDKVDSDDNDNE